MSRQPAVRAVWICPTCGHRVEEYSARYSEVLCTVTGPCRRTKSGTGTPMARTLPTEVPS